LRGEEGYPRHTGKKTAEIISKRRNCLKNDKKIRIEETGKAPF
jgi:hypothetical protein